MANKNILITGGSGTIGGKLTTYLLSRGHAVAWVTRRKDPAKDILQFEWDLEENRLEKEAVEWADIIIHLAGASIAGKRWDRAYKKILYSSRVDTAQLIFDTCVQTGEFPETFVSSSAIGYYGYDSGGVWKKESSRFGDDFLATLTKAWEEKADLFAEKGVRTVKMRSGIILDANEGALPRMAKPVRLGVGAPLGSGEQFVSWIHIDDVVESYGFVIEHEVSGPFNQVAPEPVTNRHLTKEIARVLKKPLILPNVPAFAVKILVGGMAASVLGSIRASAENLRSAGYGFRYTDLGKALEDLL